MVYDSILQLVGGTPMVRLGRLQPGLPGALFAKLEYFNPAGSVKDRVAVAMIEDAEATGRIAPGDTIIEPTSGNTGIGLAMVCAAKGYRLIITMPETMSVERRRLIAAYGAEVVLTPGEQGMSGAVARAGELHRDIARSFVPQQFANPASPRAHYRITAEEIIRDMKGRHIDYFVAGVGTGGTIVGVGRRLREVCPDIRIVAVEPAKSPLLRGGKPGPHGLQGLGANFVPEIYDASVVDAVIDISEEEAYDAARRMARNEGILVGISSGAALAAALRIMVGDQACAGVEGCITNPTVVTLLPDGGERYLSTPLFSCQNNNNK